MYTFDVSHNLNGRLSFVRILLKQSVVFKYLDNVSKSIRKNGQRINNVLDSHELQFEQVKNKVTINYEYGFFERNVL